MEKRSQWRRKQRRNNGKRHAWPLDKLFFFWETLELTWLKEHTFGEPQKKTATGAKKRLQGYSNGLRLRLKRRQKSDDERAKQNKKHKARWIESIGKYGEKK